MKAGGQRFRENQCCVRFLKVRLPRMPRIGSDRDTSKYICFQVNLAVPIPIRIPFCEPNLDSGIDFLAAIVHQFGGQCMCLFIL